MASNVSQEKLLFYAAAGGLGGFASWGLSGPSLRIPWGYGPAIFFGALIGPPLSAFLASVENPPVGQGRQGGRGCVRGWVMVVRSQSRNARGGREYPLVKGVTIIGRAEESDIGLFGDQSVLGSHAIIRREGKNFIISPTGGQIFVNRQPVAGRYPLRSGDRLEVGGTLFLFRERSQAANR